MENAFETLLERGFVKQCTDEDALNKRLGCEKLTFYCGFDPTANSLHVGSMLPIMAMAHCQRAGHRAIALIGGATAMVGDPSGKTEMRQMLSREEISSNGQRIEAQLKRFLTLDGEAGLCVNNADWLLEVNYIEFLRDIGRHFRVNEMMRAEAYKLRMEREEGLSFIEFNYQILQAYDFLVLHRRLGCALQLGGDDQWSNILAGSDLIRRVEGGEAYGLTFPLLTTARGEKMGKTAGGAVWLDASRTSPYEFYQYWINTDDRDVERFLALFTFLPMDEVRRLGTLADADIRQAKEVLAYEVTRLTHGEKEAEDARNASRAAFGGDGSDLSAVPTTTVEAVRLEVGISVVDLFVETGLAGSKSAARRLIQGGGAYVGGEQVTDIGASVDTRSVKDGEMMLRSGKKKYHRVLVR